MGCRPITQSPALAVGTLVHDALESYYSGGMDWENTFFVGSEGLQLDNPNHKLSEKIHIAFDVLIEYAYHYERMNEMNTMQVIATEFAFEIPIASGYKDDFLRGRIDMLVYDKRTKSYWIVDHKTTGGSYQENTIDHNMQFTAYLWAASKLWPDINIGGLMVNVLRLRDVKGPLPLRKGGLSKNKAAITTHRLFAEQVRLGPHTESNYTEHLEWLDANNPLFKRYWTFRQPETLKGFEKHLFSVVVEIRQNFLVGMGIDPLYILPTFESSCNYMCSFQEVCHHMEAGQYPDEFIGGLIAVAEDRYTDDMEYVYPETAADWLDVKTKDLL